MTNADIKAEALKAVRTILEIERQIRSLKAALNSWVYGLTKASILRTGGLSYAEEATKENAKIWITNILRWRTKKNDPCEVVMDYISSLDKMLLMKQSDFEVSCRGKNILINIKGGCIYEDSCKWLLAEHSQLLCPRGVIFTAAIDVGCGENYKVRVIERRIGEKPGEKCIIELFPA